MVTLEQVKSTTGIKNKDEQITALIPLVEEFIKGYCNITDIPTEYHLNAIKMIEYNLNTKTGVQSESLSRHSESFVTDYPPSVLKGLRRRLRW